MSEKNPYQQLGVSEDASFDEIQEAKTRLLQQYQSDSKLLESIEAAYDAIIMDRLKMRQEGRIKVPDRIRFPERTAEKPVLPPALPAAPAPSWLQRAIDTPSTRDVAIPGVIYAALSASIFLPASQESFLPTLLMLGIIASIFFINRKERKLGRSLLISLAALLVGVGIGSALGGVASASLDVTGEQLACLLSFLLFWIASSFLR